MSRWKAFTEGLAEFYHAPYRATLAREARGEDDLLMLIVLGEALGLPQPFAYETVELFSELAPRMHAWHLRMGMERSPLALGCC